MNKEKDREEQEVITIPERDQQRGKGENWNTYFYKNSGVI